MNLLGTPGLGSLMARRWIEGTGQLVMFLMGFVLFCMWVLPTISIYYRTAFSDTPPPPVTGGRLAIAGLILCAISWFWSLVTSVSLMREAASVKVQELKYFSAGQIKLDESSINAALASVPNWQRNGLVISRTYEFADFVTAMAFVNAVAKIAEQVQHHPDVDIRWNKVTLALTTHDTGGLTQKDFGLARECDRFSLGR